MKNYLICSNCNSLFFGQESQNMRCEKCEQNTLEKIKGRFILRCRKCGLTQNKNAFSHLHGKEPLKCQSNKCNGALKIIVLGGRNRNKKLVSLENEVPPDSKGIIKSRLKVKTLPKIPSRRKFLKREKGKNSESKVKIEDYIPFPKIKSTKKIILPKIKPIPQKIKIKDHPGIKIGNNIEYNNELYEITKKLGTGGMGAVWIIRNKKTKKMFSLKEFYYSRYHDPESGSNFCEKYWKREEKITKIQDNSPETSMKCIGSMKITDFDIPEYYIFLEYIDGELFDKWYTNRYENLKKLNIKELRMLIHDILMPIARHMYFVHQKGIVHRDLTIQNIMIIKNDRYSEENYKPVILDWGVAKDVGFKKMYKPRKPYYISSTPEATGIRNRGTPPEVMAGFEPIAATDIYMLGHIMFYLFSGGHYAGAAATNEDFVLHPGDFNTKLPHNFSRLVEYMTQYEPADRMENMVKVYDALNYLYKETEVIEHPELAKKKKKKYFLYCDYNKCYIPLEEKKIIAIGRDEIMAAGTDHSMDGHLYEALIPTDQEKFSFEIFIDSGYAYVRDFYSKMGTYVCNLTSTNQQVYNDIPIKGLDNVCILLSEDNLGISTIEVPFIADDKITYRIQFMITTKEISK